ncbi:MAG TPA: zinc-ribbon domain-containing protein [Longimicrobiaceae bacterium]
MNVRCTHCGTAYRIDPSRIPAGGAMARCARCQQAFRIDPAQAGGAGAPHAAHGHAAAPSAAASPGGAGLVAPKPTGPATPTPPAGPAGRPPAEPKPRVTVASSTGGAPAARPAPIFGPQDPEVRARRLARALVSDIIAYHQDRWERSVAAGTLREDFREEILKSWEEYVLQVGSERAHGTPYFRDALNEILAKGRQVF